MNKTATEALQDDHAKLGGMGRYLQHRLTFQAAEGALGIGLYMHNGYGDGGRRRISVATYRMGGGDGQPCIRGGLSQGHHESECATRRIPAGTVDDDGSGGGGKR